MNAIHNDTSAVLDEILQWIWDNDGTENMQLKIGVWDYAASPYTFYAVVEMANRESSRERYLLLGGETTYGSETIHEALVDLLKELQDAPPQE